jgi:hypothetical protein
MDAFDSYSVKKQIKFFKTIDEEDKIIISISINSNHELQKDILQQVNEFLEKLLLESYITEEQHLSNVLYQKTLEKQEKEQEKLRKKNEKLKLKQLKANTKKKTKITASKSLH